MIPWGLPPKPKEVEDFVKSFEKDPFTGQGGTVDRLLADRAYGERWGNSLARRRPLRRVRRYRADDFRPSAHLLP